MSLYSAIPIGTANTPKDLFDVIVGTVVALFNMDETVEGMKGLAMGTTINMFNLDTKQLAGNLNNPRLQPMGIGRGSGFTKKVPITPEKLDIMKNVAAELGGHFKKLFFDPKYFVDEIANRPVQTLMDMSIILPCRRMH